MIRGVHARTLNQRKPPAKWRWQRRALWIKAHLNSQTFKHTRRQTNRTMNECKQKDVDPTVDILINATACFIHWWLYIWRGTGRVSSVHSVFTTHSLTCVCGRGNWHSRGRHPSNRWLFVGARYGRHWPSMQSANTVIELIAFDFYGVWYRYGSFLAQPVATDNR